MPRNGSGVYTAPQNSWNPAVNGAQALPADWMAILQDLVTAMTQSTSADGQTLITGVWNFGNNRITGVGAPVGTGNALRWEQMIKGADIASDTTISIPVEGSLFDVTGTTKITSINDQFPGRIAFLRFDDEVEIENSASLKTPTGNDESTISGDVLAVVNTEPAVWEIVSWPRLDRKVVLEQFPFRGIQAYDTAGSYTWNVPEGVTKAWVTVVGAGGGPGGIGPVNGGTSSFGSFCSATGGQTPGPYTTDPSGGAGGVGIGGDLNLYGGGGGASSAVDYQSGHGGNSIFGGGAPGRGGSGRSAVAGRNGGGASGNTGTASQVGQSGGAGGGAALKLVDLTGVTSVSVTVGAGGTSDAPVSGGDGVVLIQW